MAPSSTNQSFFFYDLETSGINPRTARIMQFAGQRTDLDLNPIGDPFNILIKLSEDIIPEPGAILVTGITPQKTLAEGITEAEFFKIFTSEISKPNTVFVGFNNIRFDDEFMRFGLYRNFYDPYEWQWKDGSGRWDILDLTRIVRALRPDGIVWPFAPDGKPTNRLEYLTSVNKIPHKSAHDALADVTATIQIAKLIKQKQPKIFDYLLSIRSKKAVKEFVTNHQTFLYVSGKYSSEYEKLAIVQKIGDHPDKNDSVLVFNLFINPAKFMGMTSRQLAEAWTYKKDREETEKVPVKTLQFNRSPSIAPLAVLNNDDKKRLKIDDELIKNNQDLLNSNPDFYQKVCEAIKILDTESVQQEMVIDSSNADTKLYENFISDYDKKLSLELLGGDPDKISDFSSRFRDERLRAILPLYKARNYPKTLTSEERIEWEKHKTLTYAKELPVFVKQFEQIVASSKLSDKDEYVFEELKMYVESLIPPELYE
jgi:exodeoxyribonuclease I